MNCIKNIRLGVFSVGFFFVVLACQKIEDLNINPNEPEVVSMNNLLPNIIKDLANVMVDEAFLFGNNAAQLTAKSTEVEVDLYNWNGFDVWGSLYAILLNVQDLENKAKATENESFLGASIILKAYIFSILTDMYGPIPYSQALKGLSEGVFKPQYDSQDSIYLGQKGLLAELSRANALLSTSTNIIEGDILFGGDISKWQKFGNSLMLRLLLRISKKENVSSRLATLLTNPNNLMMSNVDNAALIYLGVAPNANPLTELKSSRFDAVRISQNLVTTFNNANDPRLAVFARPTDATINLSLSSSQYEGWLNGCGTTGCRLGYSYYDYPTHPTSNTKAAAIFMSYSEVQFLIAEAIQRGFVAGNAAIYYQNGIESSMSYYTVDYARFGWTDFNDYYNNAVGVAFNNDLNQIWQQKWIALFFHGLEPYIEVRRWLDHNNNDWNLIPFLDAPCNNINNNLLPVRFLYPEDEEEVNGENFDKASLDLGGNNQNSKMWLLQ